MSKRPRRKSADAYHHGDLRRALLDAAFRAIERGGLEDLSLRGLARTLGVSPRAPYRHFATKEALLAAVAVESFDRASEITEARVAAAGGSPRDRLRAAGEAYVLFAVENPTAFRVMHAPYDAVDEQAPELVRVRRESHARLIATIVEGQGSGDLRAGDPMHLALAWASMMHGLSVLLIEGQLGRYDRPAEATTLAKLVGRLLFDGLGLPSRAPS